MSTKKATNFYEELKNYFEKTSLDQVLKDWEKTEEYGEIGPTVEEFLNFTQQHFNLKLEEPLINGIVIKTNNLSPEFTSGFFLN